MVGILPALLALAVAGCNLDLRAALSKQTEAVKRTADMRVELHRSAEAVQRAIIAETDDAASRFVDEARQASSALAQDLRKVEPLLEDLKFREEVRMLREFGDAFQKLQELDQKLLALAVENSNVKAQRLSFGPAQEAADALRDHLDRAAPPESAPRAQLLSARVQLAVREIQALHAPHIAEADDAVMTALEERMARSEAAARTSLAELSRLLAPTRADLTAARDQLDRFAQIHREIVALSRANTDVLSLASALGERRELSATCDASLVALQDELSRHEFGIRR